MKISITIFLFGIMAAVISSNNAIADETPITKNLQNNLAAVEYEEPPLLSPEEEMEQDEWGGRDSFSIRLLAKDTRSFEDMIMKAYRDKRWLDAYAKDAISLDHLEEELDAKIKGQRFESPHITINEAKQNILRAANKLKEIRSVNPKKDLNEEEKNSILRAYKGAN